MRTKVLSVVLGALTWLMLPVLPASAEWFADLYAGAAFTQKHDIETHFQQVPRDTTTQDVTIDTSVSGGGRGGYWFESLPFLGLGLDVSHFSTSNSKQVRTVNVCISGVCSSHPGQTIEDADRSVTAIGFDVLMLRWPLFTSEQFPKGRLQPYLTAGPAIFIDRVSVDNANFSPASQSNTDAAIGAKVGAGVAWQFHKNFALFGEYRFTHYHAELEFNRAIFGEATSSGTGDTHHLLMGISFRF